MLFCLLNTVCKFVAFSLSSPQLLFQLPIITQRNFIYFGDRFFHNTTGPLQAEKTEAGTSKESIAQTSTQETRTPTLAPTPQTITASKVDEDEFNKTKVLLHSRLNPNDESFDMKDRKPDMEPFKDEVEQDAVVAENEADRAALLHEVPDAKENNTEEDLTEENEDAISDVSTSDSGVLNASPVRMKLVTPFRGRCPVCRKYFLYR